MYSNTSKCFKCNYTIPNGLTVYRAYDATFCSNYCRIQHGEVIEQVDPHFSSPNMWNTRTLNMSDPNAYIENKEIRDSQLSRQLYQILQQLEQCNISQIHTLCSNIGPYIKRSKLYLKEMLTMIETY